jgi:glycosyltransferase involved in cell wall biosynthesis
LKIIPNGINLSLYKKGNKIEGFLDGDPCILNVGRFSRSKGMEYLIRAVADLKNDFPKLKIHILGKTNTLDNTLHSLLLRKGVHDNFVFHGQIPQNSLPDYYKSADFCVFPSTLETFGLVILEAMASGSPFIASDIEAYTEIVAPNSAFLFKSCNTQELTKAISAFANDEGLRKNLAANALKAVEPYDWKNIALQYMTLYENVIR